VNGLRIIAVLPNLISLARFMAVPVTVYLIIIGEMRVCFWVFVAAGASDAVDGFIARQLDARTVLGGYLDPAADKALLLGVYLTLGFQGHMPIWLVILVVFRDLVIVGGVVLVSALSRRPAIRPSLVSKINTAAQIALAALVLAELGFSMNVTGLTEALMVVVALTTFASGAGYVIRWGRRLVRMEDSQ
jgi:cardiolipin synthase